VSKDPYRYFRIEARELIDGLGAGALELERGGGDPELVARLLRLSHTLKGAARVVKQLEIAEIAHAIEDAITLRRDAGGAFTKVDVRALLASVDRAAALLAALDAPAAEQPRPEKPGTSARAGPEAAFQTVRVEIEEMDALLSAITETGVQLGSLRNQGAELAKLARLSGLLLDRLIGAARGKGAAFERERALAGELEAGLEQLAQSFQGGVERVGQELQEVREGADRLRMVPIAVLLPSLERAARDVADALGKRVELGMTGGALRLDAHALGPLRDALLQLVRNAVAHGLERPVERLQAGKAELGRVELRVERRGQRVVIRCRDDGRGVDVAAVRRELVARGAETQASAAELSDSALLRRLLSAGVTTAAATTQHAGRGIGLDLVREAALRLKGEASIESQPGHGTSVEIAIPIALAAVAALLVDAGGVGAAIPLDAVRRTLRVQPADLARSSAGVSVNHEGKLIPFVPLAAALRLRGEVEESRAWSAVVVGAGERLAAVGVDRLRGTAEVVVRALPAVVEADPVVAGAALDAAGNPELVLDAPGLLDAAETRGDGVRESAPANLPLLVIDDSLTTRMLEQSILESAGYAVDVAVTAEQGLEKARERRYGVFIVDVEMPGMDGFEFVTRTRADPELARTPAILVSSRDSAEDFARGERAGASAYIAKGEFDQGRLLSTIRKLLS
jgi:two-component system, chemotaxis family, sensor kinase CheA